MGEGNRIVARGPFSLGNAIFSHLSSDFLSWRIAMFMVIFVTSLVTVIILIITSASYLVSLICDESDEAASNDNLALDTRHFSSTPIISPVDDLSHIVTRNAGVTESNGGPGLCSLNDNTSSQQPTATSQENQQTTTSSSEDQKTQPEFSKSPWDTNPVSHKSLLNSHLGASASKQLFGDFDSKEVQLGGTALHWCKSRKSLDKLINLGLPLEIVNKRGETALHVAARRKKLPILVGLLCYDANIEARNESGETPLIVACRANDIYACQLLLTFDADFNCKDNSGSSARHYASNICENHKNQCQLPSAAHVILAMLAAMGANRCQEPPTSKMIGKSIKAMCPDGCSPTGSYNGNSYERWQSFHKESFYKRNLFEDIIEAHLRKQKLSAETYKTQENKPSRLLTIDGGGMRGVIVCQIMLEMEKFIRKPILSYFDWIGGTSVGAFISCALCTGTPLRSLRRICFDVKDEVFSGNKPYNSKFIERVLKRTFGTTLRMSNIKDWNVAVTTVIADRDPCQLRFFRSYKSPNQLLEQHGYPVERYNNLSVNSIVSRRQPLTSNSKQRPSSGAASRASRTTSLDSVSQTGHVCPPRQTEINTNTGEQRAVASPTINEDDESSVSNPVGLGRTTDSIESEGMETSRDDALLDSAIDENNQDPLIWQAVRASAAAPFFFKPFGPYLDGGIISNNPTLDILTEYFNHERVIKFLRRRGKENAQTGARIPPGVMNSSDRAGKLDLVISLGTGRGRVIGKQTMVDFGQVAAGFTRVFSPVELLRSIRAARDLFRKLMQQSCHTEDYILDRAQAWCASLDIPYFRINPPLTSIFSIDDKRDEQIINALWQTKLYMLSMKDQLKEIGHLLDGRRDT